jgi:Domain of unknown function (DUF5602)
MHTTTGRNRVRSRIRRGAGLGIALMSVTAASACREGSAEVTRDPHTSFGPAVALGDGSMRTYVQTVGDVPIEVGVALTAAALEGLPGPHSPGGIRMPDGHHMYEFVLEMPEGNPTPYRHALIDWNPAGHEPAGVYNVPHFDFHFYTITDAARRAIDPADPAFAEKAARFPDASYLPAGYTAIPGAVPFMGAHWVDPTSPELNGQPFTQTFIFGSWDGAMIFAEPMITKAFLETRPDFSRAIPVPERHAQPGYYPASYSIRWDATTGEYRIALGGFSQR